MVWRATMELKWFEEMSEGLENPCAINGRYYPEVGATYWQLKQKWVSDTGLEEWRLIPTD
jgi:hypothetical protein